LEWDETTQKWSYIDDGTQNTLGLSPGGGSIWAPNTDEVYFGMSPVYIYHGKRPVPPATAWTWTRHSFGIGLSAGVWGTGADDVYGGVFGSIYHRVPRQRSGADAGVPDFDDPDFDWVQEYSSDTLNATFASATGTGSGDAWFFGSRGFCNLVVHKTSSE